MLGWASAALCCEPRDKWIGWTSKFRMQRLFLVANNVRFLILPSIRIHNLASKVLSLNVKRLSQDWQERFNHPIILAETFVDHKYFASTCYHAAGWICLGKTKGFAKSAKKYIQHYKRNVGSFGGHIMDRCAYLAADNIPLSFFSDLSEEEKIRSAMQEFNRYSMVNYNERSGLISMHRLVQLVTYLKIKEETSARNILEILNVLDTLFNYDESSGDRINKNIEFVSHMLSALNYAENILHKKTDSFINLNIKLGRYYYTRVRDYNEAKRRFEMAKKALLENADMRNRELQFEVDVRLAGLEHMLGHPDIAELSFKKIQNDYAVELGSLINETRVIAKISMLIGLGYINYVKHERANSAAEKERLLNLAGQYFLEALQICEIVPDFYRATIFHALGTFYYFKGILKEHENTSVAADMYKNSKDKFKEELDLRIKLFGEKNVEVARSYHKLATAFVKLGANSFIDAEFYYQKALDTQNILLPLNHPNLRETQQSYQDFQKVKQAHEDTDATEVIIKPTNYDDFYGSNG